MLKWVDCQHLPMKDGIFEQNQFHIRFAKGKKSLFHLAKEGGTTGKAMEILGLLAYDPSLLI